MRQNNSHHKFTGRVNLSHRPNHLFWQIRGASFCAVIIALLLMTTLTACLGGGDEAAATPAPGQPQQIVLSCTEVCAQQGQCGTAGDGRTLVLGHTEHPETRDHNLTFPVDTPAIVQKSTEQRIQPPNSEATTQPFSFVALIDNSKTGWVANWCIAQPAAP